MALWGNVDQAGDKPKYLSTAEKTATAGVSAAEAALAANKAKGIQHAGWVQYSTYTDAQGSTRHKSETLVAISSITSDNNADDTTVGIDPVITITAQPVNASVTTPDVASFTVAATINNGSPLSTQWQFNTGTTMAPVWVNLDETYNGNLATMYVNSVNAEYINNAEFRVIVSATGAANVISNTVTLTVA